MKKTLLILALLLTAFTFGQTNGITYQAVIYSATGESVPGIKNNNAPLANKEICLQFSIVDDYSQTEYQEKITISTDEFGMVNLVIGNGTQTGGYTNSFQTIVWNAAKKYLKVGLNQKGNCDYFDEISNQVLSYVPFALAANSATSVSGIVGIANGGTNATTITGAKTNLQLQNVDNTSDLNKPLSIATQTALNSKIDKVVGKNLSTEDFTTAEKTKLAEISGVNTGDQDLSSYATTTSTSTALALKVDKVAGKDLSTEDFTTAEKTKLASLGGNQDFSSLATLLSPTFTGTPLAPTPSSTNNSTQLATTAFVNRAIDNRFVDLTSAQNIGGIKTFGSDLVVNGLAIGKGKGQNDFNTAIGSGALNSSIASGSRNTAVGYLALTQYAGSSFDNNTGVGYFNMIGLTTGYGNTSLGAETMFNVGAASNNTAIGNQSLISTTGSNNVGVGARSGNGLTSGSNNTFIGTQARTDNNTGTITNSTAIGNDALVTTSNTIQLGNVGVTNVKTSGKLTTGTITFPNTDGSSGQVLTTNGAGLVNWSNPSSISISSINGNSDVYGAVINNGTLSLTPADVNNGGIVTNGSQTFGGNKTFSSDITVNGLTIGKGIGQVNDQNITVGENTLTNNTTGQHLIALGGGTLQSNTSANYNIAIGSSALSGNSTGENNIAIGAAALAFNNGSNNTAIGLSASLLGNSLSSVTGIGYQAGMNNTGSSNTFFGANTDQTVASTSVTNSTAIGYGAKINAANQIQLGNTSVSIVKTSGTYTGSGFKTPTGTSSQYLMADGSISNSTLSNYLPLTGGNITGQLSMGTSSPQSSAVLDVTSTTQGFLPPRMTQSQRNTINTPVAGLVVWCKNCGSNGELQVYNGTTWTNMIGGIASVVPINVGDSYGGGTVIYLFQSGNIGYVAGEFHGIIIANDDAGYSPWGCSGTTTNATGIVIGSATQNTANIIASNCSGTAAQLCVDYRGGGYSDWSLPSIDELNIVFTNRSYLPSSLSQYLYWSSSETSSAAAYRKDMRNTGTGSAPSFGKTSNSHVRAVRYF